MALQPPIDETGLQITEHTDGDIAYVEACGEVDFEGERAMRRVVERALSRGARSVIFDLRQVSYMDTGALKVLLSAKSRMVSLGGEVYVVVEDSLPKRVIYMARLQSALNVCGTVDEAFADIARRATHTRTVPLPPADAPSVPRSEIQPEA
ncbi:MAG: STAS domain-containing protein [Armatimonadetes bacterium]|nr:STAS domain-containing protein [Armatimonadota bacterium]